MRNNYDWMDDARQLAAQCWSDPETSDIKMDVQLAEAIAKRIAAWMNLAAQAQKNTEYYRNLVIRCGNAFGEAARICDDASKNEIVLCAKVPELVEALIASNEKLKKAAKKSKQRRDIEIKLREELTNLRNIFSKSSDYVLARHNRAFAKSNGGLNVLANELEVAVRKYESVCDEISFNEII